MVFNKNCPFPSDQFCFTLPVVSTAQAGIKRAIAIISAQHDAEASAHHQHTGRVSPWWSDPLEKAGTAVVKQGTFSAGFILPPSS